MNSPNRAPQHTIRSFKSRPTPASVAVPRQIRVGTAANDDKAAVADLFQNPLWIMAIALGVFCAVVALVMAFD